MRQPNDGPPRQQNDAAEQAVAEWYECCGELQRSSQPPGPSTYAYREIGRAVALIGVRRPQSARDALLESAKFFNLRARYPAYCTFCEARGYPVVFRTRYKKIIQGITLAELFSLIPEIEIGEAPRRLWEKKP